MGPQKRGRGRGEALVYDPAAHKEYVTGFRKRKQARRLQATKDIADADKKSRREARKEKRDILRRTAARARGLHVADSSDDEEDGGGSGKHRSLLLAKAPKGVSSVSTQYDGADEDAIVTTSVTPLETFTENHMKIRHPTEASRSTSKVSSKAKSRDTAKSGREGKEDSVTKIPAEKVIRKQTRSSGKKLSKMHKHSRIAKVRRQRARGDSKS